MTKEEAIDLLDNLIGFIEDNHGSDYDKALKIAIKALEQEPKTGKWVSQDEDDLKISNYRCSNCGYYQDDVTNYCPDCGAKMRSEE